MGDVLTPQAYQNNQTFDIDIEKMYRDFISGYKDKGQKSISIDDLRSHVSVDKIDDKLFGQILDSIIGKVRKKSNASPELFKPEQRVQESRCHAFFRILGLPVVGSGMRMYNPGHDITTTGKANLEKKIEIARSALDNFRKLSNAREQFANSNLKIFSNQESLAAATLALSSGTSGTKNVNIRKFNTPFEKSDDPFDMDFTNQKATIDPTVIVGDNETSLTLFQDAEGSFPNPRPPYDRLHIIKPFIVDPRIDFTVRNPSGTLIAVPFVPDNSCLKVGSNSQAIKPLLEKIIIERFSTIDQASQAGTSEKSLIESIKNISSNVQAKEIIDKIASNDIYKLGEQTKFIQYVNMINALMIRLFDAVRIIHKVQSLYYWLPIPSIIGPEGGSSVRSVIVTDKISQELITQADFNIFSKQIQSKFNKIDAQAAKSKSTVNSNVFAFASSNIFGNTYGPDTTEALGDTSAATLTALNTKRKSIIQKANSALRTIEIIMGDFSGFGICDIIAITGALYIMPKEDLLGFLDEDALARMTKNTGIVPDSVPNIEESMKSLLSRVKDFYTLMDSIFEDLRHNNKLPS